MGNKNPQLVNDEIYHVILRSVGETVVFGDEKDFFRGIFSIYELNNKNPVNIWERRRERAVEKKKRGPTSLTMQERDMFVELFAFSFMPNHLHLILRQIKDDGISQFMQKVGTGYASYFNRKYNIAEKILGNKEGKVDQLFTINGKLLHTTNSFAFEKMLADGHIRTDSSKDGIYKTSGASFADGNFAKTITFQSLYDDQNTRSEDKKFNTQKYKDKVKDFVKYCILTT